MKVPSIQKSWMKTSRQNRPSLVGGAGGGAHAKSYYLAFPLKQALSVELGFSPEDSSLVVDTIGMLIRELLERGRCVAIPKVGIFQVKTEFNKLRPQAVGLARNSLNNYCHGPDKPVPVAVSTRFAFLISLRRAVRERAPITPGFEEQCEQAKAMYQAHAEKHRAKFGCLHKRRVARKRNTIGIRSVKDF